MSRAVNLSPLGLYNWDNTIFDTMLLPEAIDRQTLIQNLLAETAELEVLYPAPAVFKNLVAVWSMKQLGVWEELYATTQYEYNPIENYNRYETGSDGGTGSTSRTGTDTAAETTTNSGTDGRTETITHGGTDTVTETKADGGTETEAGTTQITNGGKDTVTGEDKKGHYIAAYDSAASGNDDGLVKQTRDEDDAKTETAYGKTENGTSSRTTTFGKTENNSIGTAYGKTENVTESINHGHVIGVQKSGTSGEQVTTENAGTHELHAHGNIGVMSTQDMIKQQRNIVKFNLYDYIIEEFKMRFCILVY